MKGEICPIEEVYEDVLSIHNYNLNAITFHILFLLSKNNATKNKYTFFSIKKDLSENLGLEKYRSHFLKINEELKEDIVKFQELSEFEIEGFGVLFNNLEYLSEKTLNLLSSKLLSSKKNELLDIILSCRNIIKNIDITLELKKND